MPSRAAVRDAAWAVHTRRLTAQQLSGPPAASPEAVVERLLAVQAQDPRGARLAVRARSTGVLAADVDAGLTNRRSLLVTWLNRGTLHLVRAEDYWWLHPLTTPQLATANRTRLRQEGVSEAQAARGVDVVAEQVATLGPRTRAELRDALVEAGVPTAGQALVHVLFAATLAGHVVRGPLRGAEQCFVDVGQWFGPAPEPLDRPEALARLARRYLVGHGPADARDLARWAGLTLGDARRALAGIADEVVEDEHGLVDLAGREVAGDVPVPRLLGSFDPVLLGWESRDAVVGAHRGIVTTNGLFRPFAMVGGRAVAIWRLVSGQLTIRLLEQVRRADLAALEADAIEVQRYLGLPARTAAVET